MAYAFSETTPATSSIAMYTLKTLLVAQGWVVMDSGDGLALYGAGADIIVSGAAGAGGLGNTAAWFRIQSPDGVREFTLQQGLNYWTYRVKYSRADKFTGGTPGVTQTPSATDEQILLGGGSDAAPTYGNGLSTPNGSYYFKIGADNAAPYTFFAVGLPTAGGPAVSAWLFDYVTDATPADAELYVHYLLTGGVLQDSGLDDTSTGPIAYAPSATPSSWYRYACLVGAGSTTIYPLQLPVNPITGKDEIIPVLLSRQSNDYTEAGYKGQMSMMRWLGIARTTGDTLTVSAARDRIVVSDVSLPWGGTVPIVGSTDYPAQELLTLAAEEMEVEPLPVEQFIGATAAGGSPGVLRLGDFGYEVFTVI